MFEDCFGLCAIDSRKPGKKVINRRSVLQVFKQCAYGHTGPAENPGTAELAGSPLNRRAL